MNYSLLKSRTFWTIIFNFFFAGFAAISGTVPAGVVVVVSGILTAVASYYHLQTAKTAGAVN